MHKELIEEEKLLRNITICTVLLTLLIIAYMVVTIIVLNNKSNEIERLKNTNSEVMQQLQVCTSKYDTLKQTYEEVVPKQQYIEDVEYLESEILKLRQQLEEK